jgi:5,10-methylene-tetrahydrofolate dehydrogenase/methenyl tetrahydrofolate cyclohydrolase
MGRKGIFGLIVIMAVSVYVGVVVGYNLASRDNRTIAVCHSTTEDSVMTDCNYQNGAWYRK